MATLEVPVATTPCTYHHARSVVIAIWADRLQGMGYQRRIYSPSVILVTLLLVNAPWLMGKLLAISE